MNFSSGLGVDLCSQSGVCENGVCVGTRDGFTCQCRRGFTLTADKRTCEGKEFSFHFFGALDFEFTHFDAFIKVRENYRTTNTERQINLTVNMRLPFTKKVLWD